MKQLSLIILLIFIFGFQNDGYSQKGYQVIEKAEKRIEKGDFEKALKILGRAEKMDYGFCGNAHMEAKMWIDSLRYTIHMKNGNYKLARTSMDSIIWFGAREDIDSIKVRSYQYEYGAQYLKNNIKESLNNAYVTCVSHDCYGIIPLKEIKESLKFKIYDSRFYFQYGNNLNQGAEKWIDKFKASKAYKLLTETN